LQPFNDAIKLFSKENITLSLANQNLYLMSPALALALALLVFAAYPLNEIIIPRCLTLLFIYLILRINVYPVLLSGWRFAAIGALHAVAQTISYAIIILFFIRISKSLSLAEVTLQNLF